MWVARSGLKHKADFLRVMCLTVFFFLLFHLSQIKTEAENLSQVLLSSELSGNLGMPLRRCLRAVCGRCAIGCLSLAHVGKNSMCKMKLRTLLYIADRDELELTAGVNKQ